MPGSCLGSTKPRTSVSEPCKARIRTNHVDKEEQASQIYHNSLAFGAKPFPDLHLAICQAPSTVGDLVSSLKKDWNPQEANHSVCTVDAAAIMWRLNPLCAELWTVFGYSYPRGTGSLLYPTLQLVRNSWLWWWREEIPENSVKSWDCSLLPL